MIEAGLVVLACSLGKGCIETSTQFYNTNPELKQIVNNTKQLSYQYLGQFTVEYTLPLVLISLNKNGTIKITRNIAFSFEKDRQIINFKKEF